MFVSVWLFVCVVVFFFLGGGYCCVPYWNCDSVGFEVHFEISGVCLVGVVVIVQVL